MNILFLPAYFTPEIVSNSYLDSNLRTAFAREGYRMEVHAPMPTRGISADVRRAYRDKRHEVLEGGLMTVHRFSMFREGRHPILRASRYALCCLIQFWRGVTAKRVDVMLITSTPPINGAMAALIKKRTGVPFVYNLQDIFPDSLVSTGLAKEGSLVWRVGRWIERLSYRNADRIVVISEGFKRNLLAKGVPYDKIEVIHNWIDEDAIVPIDRSNNKLFDKYGLDRSAFYIAYSGNFGHTQNLGLLLDAAEGLKGLQEIRFVLIGEGAQKQELEAAISMRHLSNVIMLPFQPYDDLAYVFSLGDVGLVISKPRVGQNSVPSKTWGIMSAGRPVLASFDANEIKDIIERCDCGIWTEAGDANALKIALLSLYQDRERCLELGRNGRRFVLNNLTRSVGTSKWVQVLRAFERKTAGAGQSSREPSRVTAGSALEEL